VHKAQLCDNKDKPLKSMIFYSFLKTLVGKEVAVELKNDVVLTGTLQSVDQYLNIKLSHVSVVNKEKYPQLVRLHIKLEFTLFAI
jgi:small nuclear ribonucleoprotein (snRNP)-like protein